MKIKSLHVYPIKGLGGIELQEANLLERGVQYVRRWMLVDSEGLFISQRTDARLALFECSIGSDLKVSYRGNEISIDLDKYSDVKVLATVWDDELYTYEVSQTISEWFSSLLDMQCRLVRMVDGYDRFKKLIKGPEQTRVSFADGYPFHIIGTASLEELNSKLSEEVSSKRFRANIIVETTIAYEEDTWDLLLIGNSKLQVIKACSRCQVVNIDQMNAGISKQPLKTLATYRMEDNNVRFGANAICLIEGDISVGDSITFVDK